MNAKKLFACGVLAAGAVATLASCGESKYDGLRVSVASTPDQMDPTLNSSVDGATYAVHLFSGLIRYVPTADGKGLELAPDLAEAMPTKSADGSKTKYTFKLRDGIKFSDGSAIKAQDFVDSWNRAASYSVIDDKGTEDENDDETLVTGLDADYGYMFEVIDGYDSLYDLKEENEEAKLNFLNVKATDDKTLEVVLPTDVPYFTELCAFPSYQVLKGAADLTKDKTEYKTLDNSGTWAKKAKCVTSGPYKLTQYKDGVQLQMTKNESYWDAENIKRDKITCVFSDDDSSLYGQFQSGELKLIATFPVTMIETLKTTAEYHSLGQLGTYYVCYNVNSDCFDSVTKGMTVENKQKAEEEIRTALNLLIDRKAIVENVTKGGQTPSTGFVGAGLTDPAGGEFVDHNGTAGDGKGYFGDANNYAANKAKALEILAKYYTVTDGKVTGLSIDYLYNTGTGHKNVAEALQSQFKAVGITVNVSNQDWAQFLQTRKTGDYDVARNGWLADYNDPISFLDMWVSGSGNNDCQLGKKAKDKDGNEIDGASVYKYEIDCTAVGGKKYTGTWAQTYDALIADIKSESDTAKRYKLMHKAEDLLISTGCIGSVYNYVDTYLQSTSLKDVYASPLGYKYFAWSTDATA